MLTKILLAISMVNPVSNAYNFENIVSRYENRMKVNLEDIIIDNNLGKIEDPSEKKLNNILESKYNIDSQQIEYSNLDYSGTRILAKSDSKDYSGSKYVSFDSQLSFKFSGNTKTVDARAYNSKDDDADTLTIEYAPDLGRNAFLEKYKHVEFYWRGVTWDNKGKSEKATRYHNEKSAINGSEDKDKTMPTKKTYSILNKSMKKTQLYSREYSNVNSMKSYGHFSYEWLEETIKLNFTVEAFAYATAWNAYWAHARNQMEIFDLKFVG
ncbi:hypothetical protein [Spiroplasma endosymbiont of Panorpa germanica]|uniref:hypothetical protein n=1 Tax=Spiroplasma endosymbiont of Panorpa germanica TaxID=3066314 RepID=UPI0030D4C629